MDENDPSMLEHEWDPNDYKILIVTKALLTNIGSELLTMMSVSTKIIMGLIGLLLIILARQIVFPTIWRYPWSKPKKNERHGVVFAGSFNPPHNGHLEILRHLSSKYGEVIAVIGVNPNKTHDVSPMERAQLLQDMIKVSGINDGKIKPVRVEVVTYYVWRFAMAERCRIMFRGIRSWRQDGLSEWKLLVQNTWGPIFLGPLAWPMPTVHVEGKPEYNYISSTLIRDMCQESSSDDKAPLPDLSSLVPPSLSNRVAVLYSKNKAN